MQTVDIMRFRERLEVKSETTQRMSMTELMALCKERQAAPIHPEELKVMCLGTCMAPLTEYSEGPGVDNTGARGEECGT